MAEYERGMVRWTENKDGTFKCVEPQLLPGEKRIIPLFQDESSFHAGEYKSNIWCVSFVLALEVLTLISSLGKGCVLGNKNL